MNLKADVFAATLVISLNFILAKPLSRENDIVFEYQKDFPENCEIIVTDAQQEEFNFIRAGLIDTRYRWPNNTVVYNMNSPPFEQYEKDLVERSLKSIEDVTCVKFVRRTNEDYYVNLTADSGCSSQVGYQKSTQTMPQRLNLSRPGCFYMGTIIHEFLHTLGFFHTQSASNRDEYVTINWENIEKGKEHNFNKYGTNIVTDFGIEYDYLSIMHYGAYYFSVNQEPTIETHDSMYQKLIGQRNGLSEKDVEMIKRMYNCP